LGVPPRLDPVALSQVAANLAAIPANFARILAAIAAVLTQLAPIPVDVVALASGQGSLGRREGRGANDQ
jgi:hypothetical protein